MNRPILLTRYSLVITFIVGLIIGWTCLCMVVAAGSFLKSAMAGDERRQPAIVFGKAVKVAELYDLLTYPARVVPKANTVILAEDDGVVSRISVPLGEAVRAGQKILFLTHTDPVYRYAPLVIRSPISGIVSSIDVSEGSQVTKGQRLVSVTDPSRIRVDMEVPAADLPSLKRGLLAEFKAAGIPGEVSLRVRGISPFVDPGTGTATCELELVESSGTVKAKAAKALLAPGLVGRVTLKTDLRKGISIPEYALVYRDDKPFVRTLSDGNKSKLIPVSLGKRQQGEIEILRGLKDKDFLIERTSRYVADGESVVVQKQGGEPGETQQAGAAAKGPKEVGSED